MDPSNTLRSSFNPVAREYDAIRPGYPEELIEDVVRLSGIPQGGQALEIGCGTGQATLAFARRGYRILCLDIGPDLLAVAQEKLRDYPLVKYRCISFEQWPATVGRYDLVYSATAFHWIRSEVGYPKAALALKPGGGLAIFSNEHPRPYQGFFEAVQVVYHELVPEWDDPRQRPTTEAEIQKQADHILATGLFASLQVRTYAWSQTYSSAEYVRLLDTYSTHRSLPQERRSRLYQAIAALIDAKYGGQVEKNYLSVLFLAKTAWHQPGKK